MESAALVKAVRGLSVLRHFTPFGLNSVIGPLDLTVIFPQALLASRKVEAEAAALVGTAQHTPLLLFLSSIKLCSFRLGSCRDCRHSWVQVVPVGGLGCGELWGGQSHWLCSVLASRHLLRTPDFQF